MFVVIVCVVDAAVFVFAVVSVLFCLIVYGLGMACMLSLPCVARTKKVMSETLVAT